MSEAWLHLHLPRLAKYRSVLNGDLPPSQLDDEVISLKVPGEKIRYVSHAVLRNARFHVSEKGRQRCLKTGQRNVHAWVVGELLPLPKVFRPSTYLDHDSRQAVYDPWKGDSFVDLLTKESVYEASRIVMMQDRVWYE
jgi:hypothetical protein